MRDEINKCLQTILNPLFDGKVKEAAMYSLLAKGKRIRPIMMLTTLQSYGIDYKKYIDVACAIEMIHTYSLIHDDLPSMDNDDLRRGRLTCHKAFDEATAILAGDALLTEAFGVVCRNVFLTDNQKVQIVALLSQAAGQSGMIYGQQQDLAFENKQATLEELKDIHTYKTGCLFQAPLVMAGIIARPTDLENLRKLGAMIGLLFQIQDDILDVIGDEATLGKKTGSDLKQGKSTYVSLLGLEKAQQEVEVCYQETLALIYGMQINHGLMMGIVEAMMKRHD